jgi:hypothetical protein
VLLVKDFVVNYTVECWCGGVAVFIYHSIYIYMVSCNQSIQQLPDNSKVVLDFQHLPVN